MTRTISWSPRVGEVWTNELGTVEVVGEHTQAQLVLLRDQDGEREWIPTAELESAYRQERCETCGVPLTGMRKLLVEEATRNSPKPIKSRPGTYCTKPCCATRHAPKTC